MTSPPTPSSRLLDLLRRELVPTRERIRLSVRTGLACMTTVGLLLALQVPQVALGAFLPLVLLSPITTCTLSNMVWRLLILAVPLALWVPVAGFLIDVPWLLLPAFFALAAAGLYLAPLTERPVAFQSANLGLVMVMLVAHFDPHGIGPTALWAGCSIAIAIVVCTAFAVLLWPQDEDAKLAAQLADGLRASRMRFDAALRRYLSEGDTGPLAEPPPIFVLGQNMQALERARQSSASGGDGPLRAGLIGVAQRVAVVVANIESIVAERLPDGSRQRIRPAFEVLSAQLDQAIDAYAERAAAGFKRAVGASSPERDPPWPDLEAQLAHLDQRRSQLGRDPAWQSSGQTEMSHVAQRHLSALIEALRELVQVLHSPPGAIEREASERLSAHPRPWQIGRGLHLDRNLAAASLKGGLATTLAFVIVLATGHLYLQTALWTCVLVTLTSYGAIVRKSVLRVIGALAGGVLALVLTIALIPSMNGPSLYLLSLGVVCWAADYGGRGSPQVAYGFQQMGITFLICVATLKPTGDVAAPLERLLGILIGLGAIYLCFRFLWPDYAGNQTLRELAAILRPLPALVPEEGRALPGSEHVAAIDRERVLHTENVLRLIDEAIFEGRGSGIDADAALAACGVARRISLRLSSIAYARTQVPLPALPAQTAEVMSRLEAPVRAWIEATVELLETADRLGQPHSRARREGRSRLAQIAARPLPEIAPPPDTLPDFPYHGDFARWPSAAKEALSAELVHLARIVALLPQLHRAAARTCLPEPDKLPSLLFGIRKDYQPA